MVIIFDTFPKYFIETPESCNRYTPLCSCILQRHLESVSPLLGLKHLFFSVPQRFAALFSLHLSGHYKILPHCHTVEVVQ